MGFFADIRARFSKPKPTPAPTPSRDFGDPSGGSQSTPPESGGTSTPRPSSGGGRSSGGGGGSSSSGGGSTPAPTQTIAPIQSIPGVTTPTKSPTKSPNKTNQPVGFFFKEQGFKSGFVTETGKFFPTRNESFVPRGFTTGGQSFADIALGNQSSRNQSFPTSIRSQPTGLFTNSNIQQTGILAISEKDEGRIGNRGAFISRDTSPSGFLDATQTGRDISNTPSTNISPFSSIFGLTEEEIKTENVRARSAEKQAKLLSSTRKRLRDDPKSFVGQTGVISEPSGALELTPDFFAESIGNIRSESIAETNQKFKDLPTREKARARFSSVITGTGKLGVGVGEFAGFTFQNLGQQNPTVKQDSFAFREGGFFGGIRDSPTFNPTDKTLFGDTKGFLKESIGAGSITQGSLLVAGVGLGGRSLFKQGSKEGFGVATAETLKTFSPLSIKSQRFSEPTKNLFFDEAISFKAQSGNKITRNIFLTSTDSSVTGLSTQTSKVSKGGKITEGVVTNTLEVPFLEVRGGGGFIKSGSTILTEGGVAGSKEIISAPSSIVTNLGDRGFFGKQTGNIGLGESTSITQPIRRFDTFDGNVFQKQFVPESNIFKRSKSFGLTSEIKDTPFTSFVSGKKTPKFENFGIVDESGLIAGGQRPSSKFGLKPNVKGTEVDLNKLLAPTGDLTGGSIGITTKPKPRPSNSQIQKGLFSQLSSIQNINLPTLPKTSKPTGINELISPTTTGQGNLFRGIPESQFQGDIRFERSSGGLLPTQSLKLNQGVTNFQTLSNKGKVSNVNNLFQPTISRSGSKVSNLLDNRLRSNVVQSSIVDQSIKQTQKLGTKQLTKLTTKQKQTQRQSSIFSQTSLRRSRFNVNFRPRPFGGIGFPFPSRSTSKRKRSTRTKSPFGLNIGRTPSFDAIGLGIFGKRRARGELIGAGSLVTRPILGRKKRGKKKKKRSK